MRMECRSSSGACGARDVGPDGSSELPCTSVPAEEAVAFARYPRHSLGWVSSTHDHEAFHEARENTIAPTGPIRPNPPETNLDPLGPRVGLRTSRNDAVETAPEYGSGIVHGSYALGHDRSPKVQKKIRLHTGMMGRILEHEPTWRMMAGGRAVAHTGGDTLPAGILKAVPPPNSSAAHGDRANDMSSSGLVGWLAGWYGIPQWGSELFVVTSADSQAWEVGSRKDGGTPWFVGRRGSTNGRDYFPRSKRLVDIEGMNLVGATWTATGAREPDGGLRPDRHPSASSRRALAELVPCPYGLCGWNFSWPNRFAWAGLA